MGFLVSQHGQLGAIPPPPFLSVSPLESMQSGDAILPPQKGYLSNTCAIPYENKANGCDTPLCDTISKGYCAIWGDISHWAAKFTRNSLKFFLGYSKPVVWGTRGLHPGCPWFSSFPCGFRDFCYFNTQLLVCSCLSCFCRFCRFCDFGRFRDPGGLVP